MQLTFFLVNISEKILMFKQKHIPCHFFTYSVKGLRTIGVRAKTWRKKIAVSAPINSPIFSLLGTMSNGTSMQATL